MIHPASPHGPGDDREARLHQHRIDDVVSAGAGNLMAGACSFAFLVLVAAASGAPGLALAAWAGACLVEIVLGEVVRRDHRRDPTRLPPARRERHVALLSLGSGALIAVWAWAFTPWDDAGIMAMVIAVLVANWVGAAVRHAGSSLVFGALSVGLVLGPVAALLVRGEELRVVGIMAVPLGIAIALLHVDGRRQLLERIRDREELALLTARQAAVFDTIAEAVLTVDGGIVGMCNARFLAVVGRSRAQCEGFPVADVIPDLADPGVVCDGRPIPATLPATATRTRVHLELRGHEVGGGVDHQVWVCTDVTDRVRREQEMDALASKDDLTGFLNRRAVHERLGRQFASDTPPEGLLLVDLDGFKAVNDRHGHAVGDIVLARLATRLRDGLRDVTLGRIGGDEFVVVVAEGGRFAVEAVADAICRLCREPVEVGGVVLKVAASVGVVWAGRDLDVANALLLADQAMYRAKQAGGDRWVLADPPTATAGPRSSPSPPPAPYR